MSESAEERKEYPPTDEGLAEMARDIRREALEEACEAMCRGCRVWTSPDLMDGWHHDGHRNPKAPCKAAPIRALMEEAK